MKTMSFFYAAALLGFMAAQPVKTYEVFSHGKPGYLIYHGEVQARSVKSAESKILKGRFVREKVVGPLPVIKPLVP